MSRILEYPEMYRKLHGLDIYGNRASVREVTFQLTEACNLACTYCYQINKSPKVMSWDVAKRIVDLLFEMSEVDNPKSFINTSTEAIILDFIGGEPLLETKLMHKICDYFWDKAIKKGSRWAETFRISISSNGTLYFIPEFQDFINKYERKVSYSISIDGDKQMHDACRIYPDGRGSFDDAKRAQDDYTKRFGHASGTKATISRANLPYIHDTIKYFIDIGYTQIFANTVYEENWNTLDAKLFYSNLKQIANTLLELPNGDDIYLSLFEEDFFKPKREEDVINWCGGTGNMLAFDTEGNAYPCIRYMPSSLGDEREPLIVGDCWNGIYKTEKEKEIYKFLDSINRRTQSTDECFYCPIAEGCSWCSGYNYQLYGTPNKRCTRICWMHRARSLANAYYWNKRYRKNSSDRRFKIYLPRKVALEIIDETEFNELYALSMR